MFISHIRLYNFRNFLELDVDFSDGLNVIYGDNAQGKTNLLESVYFLSSLKPERARHEANLIMYEKPEAFLKGVFDTYTGPVERDIILYRDKKKRVLENERHVKVWSEICDKIGAVFFSPEDLNMIKGDPSARRKFIDEAIFQIKPGYARLLQSYHKVLAHRNMLLKSLRKNPAFLDTLDSWDVELSEFGQRILKERLNFLEKMRPVIKEYFKNYTMGYYELDINYMSSIKASSPDSIKQSFIRQLKITRETDIRRTYTTCGPHRDDLKFTIDGQDVRFFGSQGQQRLLVLCLKMTQAKLFFMEKGCYPIMLLDDVMSELDAKKRKLILENQESQIFITTTDLEFIPQDIQKRSHKYLVQAGKLKG